jgi:hypothetical protein
MTVTVEPLYYVKNGDIYKRPVSTPREGGGTTVSIGFPVCRPTEFVGTEGAQFIADALNQHDTGTR